MSPPTRSRKSRCSIKGCPSVSGRQLHRGVVFNKLPSNPTIRHQWLTNCGISDTLFMKRYLVCSRHFHLADFQPVKNNKYLLKEGAVPTVFPWATFPYVEPISSAVIESSQSSTNIDDKPGEMNQQLVDGMVEIKSEWNISDTRAADSKKVSIVTESQFSFGTRIEAQDLHGVWHFGKVAEVGNNEVLVLFEQSDKSNAPVPVREWIPTNSSRFRPFRVPVATYVPGEKCLALFRSRKFSATVQKVLENNTYELIFDDGFVKVVKAVYMSKVKATQSAKTSLSNAAFVVAEQNPYLPIPKFDLSKINLPSVPKDGEWCCNWINEIPVGIEGYLEGRDGYKRPTIIVEDWRLPVGWTKHVYQTPGHRNDVLSWNVVLVAPTNKRYRFKADVKKYFEEKGEEYDLDMADFSMHIKRAKDLGLFIFTDEYKEELKNRKLVATKAQEAQLMDKLFACPEPGCTKKFRKENQLQIHIKHYHNELAIQLGIYSGTSETEDALETVDASETSDASETANISDLAYQQIPSQPMDGLILNNEIDAGKVHTYHTPNSEHTEQFDTFFISYVDSKYD